MRKKIINISKIYSWDINLNSLDVKLDQQILIENDKIIKIDTLIKDEVDTVIDAKNCVVTPGFIDSHTHPIFVGNRSRELSLRVKGKTYQEIADEGGGIISSIRSVRESDFDFLYNSSKINVDNIYKNGTTLLEAKSGYGLTFNDEDLKTLLGASALAF